MTACPTVVAPNEPPPTDENEPTAVPPPDVCPTCVELPIEADIPWPADMLSVWLVLAFPPSGPTLTFPPTLCPSEVAMPLFSESVMPILAVWTNESAQLEVLIRLEPCDQLLDAPCVEDTESVSA